METSYFLRPARKTRLRVIPRPPASRSAKKVRVRSAVRPPRLPPHGAFRALSFSATGKPCPYLASSFQCRYSGASAQVIQESSPRRRGGCSSKQERMADRANACKSRVSSNSVSSRTDRSRAVERTVGADVGVPESCADLCRLGHRWHATSGSVAHAPLLVIDPLSTRKLLRGWAREDRG